MEMEKSSSLLKFMEDEGLVPSMEEETRRSYVIHKLKEILVKWAQRVAYQRRLPTNYTKSASATILTYGSYGLGVHSSESDIDALCVGPSFATMSEDFFIVLRNMLASQPEVSDLRCFKNAKVPIIRFKFDKIWIDLPYAKLNTISVRENVNLDDPVIFENVDETSSRSFSGVLANKYILERIPNLELYRSALRCVKYWAKNRGIYSNLHGFFGGVHLAVLTAVICQRNPMVPLCALLPIFFKTFALWPWPTPVSLEEGVLPPNNSPFECSRMPIQLPGLPNMYCHSKITRSTFYRIRVEFLRGYSMTKDILHSSFNWSSLFEPFAYARNYARFLKIRLSSSNQDNLQDWVGWVKSRIHYLAVKLEVSHGFCDPNPTDYIDIDSPEPSIVFYWGLQVGRNHNVDCINIATDFMMNISIGYEGPLGNIELSVVKASDIPKTKTNDEIKIFKACMGTVDKNQQPTPLYSNHAPNYVVGYLAAASNDENEEQLDSNRAVAKDEKEEVDIDYRGTE